jgi:hypothetical protein
MKLNKWTVGLAAVGVVSLASARADERMSQVQTALSNTTISGYVDTSFNWAVSPGNNSPAAFIPYQGPNKQNGFNLDVIKLSIAKPQDESPWASGYQVDLLFGPDAATFGASSSDFAIEQAYIALRTPVGNGIDWKVGVFNSPIGYESFDSINDPNYTRSWGYAVEPTTFTGILASYKITDQWAISAGIANTANNVINGRAYQVHGGAAARSNDWNKTFMGSVSYTAPSAWGSMAGSTIDAGVVYGFNGDEKNGAVGTSGFYASGDQINYYAGATLNTPWKPLKVGAALDYVHNLDDGVFLLATDRELNAFVLGLYGTYQATDKLNLSARFEYINLEAEGMPAGMALSKTSDGFGVTGTVDYALWANVISRLEVRWDHLNQGYLVDQPDGTGSTDSVGFYANLIYKF